MKGYIIMIVSGGMTALIGIALMSQVVSLIPISNTSAFYSSYQTLVNFIGTAMTIAGLSLVVAGFWGIIEMFRQ